MAAKKGGGRSKRNNNPRRKKQQRQLAAQDVNDAINNNKDDPVDTVFSQEGIKVVQKFIEDSTDSVSLEKELEQLLEMVIRDKSMKKLDPKKVRKVAPEISKYLSQQTLRSDHLGVYIGRQFLMVELDYDSNNSSSNTTNKDFDFNKILVDNIAVVQLDCGRTGHAAAAAGGQQQW